MRIRILNLTLMIFVLCGQISAQIRLLNEFSLNDRVLQHRTPESIDITSFDGTLFEILDQVFDSVRHDPVIKGISASLMTPEGEVWNRADGLAAELPMVDSLRTDHLMGMGSITKSFVAATILLMYEDGLLDLEDLIKDYVGPYSNISIWVRIRHLLGHRSGIYNYTDNPAVWTDVAEYPDSLWVLDTTLHNYVLEPVFPVNQGWSYSNTNYLLLGRIIESITGRPWYEVVRERVIDPMGLTYTFAYPFEEPDTSELSHAWGEYNGVFTDLQGLGLSDVAYFSRGASGGCLISTPNDLVRFTEQLHGGHLLQDSTLMIAYMDNNPNSANSAYGMGVASNNLGGIENWGHGGSIIYQSQAFYFPEMEMTLAVQQNEGRTGVDFDDDLNDMLIALLDAYIQYSSTTSSDDPRLLDKFTIFPNPAHDQFSCEWHPAGAGLTKGQCAIITLQGQTVMQFNITPGLNRVHIGDLLPGAYLVRLNGTVRKVIVQ